MRLKDHHKPPARPNATDGVDDAADLGGMMAIVVKQREALVAGDAFGRFESPRHAAKVGKALHDGIVVDAFGRGDRDRCQGVLDVVATRQRNTHGQGASVGAQHLEGPRRRAVAAQGAGPAVGVRREAVAHRAPFHAPGQLDKTSIVGADHKRARRRQPVREIHERLL